MVSGIIANNQRSKLKFKDLTIMKTDTIVTTQSNTAISSILNERMLLNDNDIFIVHTLKISNAKD